MPHDAAVEPVYEESFNKKGRDSTRSQGGREVEVGVFRSKCSNQYAG